MDIFPNNSTDSAKRLSEILLHGLNSGYVYWNVMANTIYQENEDILPAGLAETKGNPLDLLMENGSIHPDNLSLFGQLAGRVRDGVETAISESVLEADCQLKNRDGSYTWYRINLYLTKNDNNQIVEIVAIFNPLTEQKILRNRLLTYFTSDKNPMLYSSRIKNSLDTAPEDVKFAFIQFDVCSFRTINDNYGVETGDRVLQYINDSLDVLCSGDQIFCRLSADLFMVFTAYRDLEQLISFVKFLNQNLCRFEDVSYQLSFGIYLVTDRTLPTRTMGDYAGLARREVKKHPLETYMFYKEEFRTSVNSKEFVQHDMKRALENGEFVMYLQPKYSISQNKVVGAEALVRWIHPKKGLIPPCEFIPVFEENGFIALVDKCIWHAACRTLRKWLDNGINPVPISVNVSRSYLDKREITDYIDELMNLYNLPKHLLELEITESVENIAAENAINRFKKQGYTLLMDDFGSGYSSLNMLKNTPFDTLKIDREFLSEFLDSERGQKIITHTIRMSQDIGLGLVAEGVENQEQADFLSSCGCDTAQGFHYSKPVTLEEFESQVFKK